MFCATRQTSKITTTTVAINTTSINKTDIVNETFLIDSETTTTIDPNSTEISPSTNETNSSILDITVLSSFAFVDHTFSSENTTILHESNTSTLSTPVHEQQTRSTLKIAPEELVHLKTIDHPSGRLSIANEYLKNQNFYNFLISIIIFLLSCSFLAIAIAIKKRKNYKHLMNTINTVSEFHTMSTILEVD